MHLPPPGAQVEHSSRSRAGIGHISAPGASLTYLQKWWEGRGAYKRQDGVLGALLEARHTNTRKAT